MHERGYQEGSSFRVLRSLITTSAHQRTLGQSSDYNAKTNPSKTSFLGQKATLCYKIRAYSWNLTVSKKSNISWFWWLTWKRRIDSNISLILIKSLIFSSHLNTKLIQYNCGLVYVNHVGICIENISEFDFAYLQGQYGRSVELLGVQFAWIYKRIVNNLCIIKQR